MIENAIDRSRAVSTPCVIDSPTHQQATDGRSGATGRRRSTLFRPLPKPTPDSEEEAEVRGPVRGEPPNKPLRAVVIEARRRCSGLVGAHPTSEVQEPGAKTPGSENVWQPPTLVLLRLPCGEPLSARSVPELPTRLLLRGCKLGRRIPYAAVPERNVEPLRWCRPVSGLIDF